MRGETHGGRTWKIKGEAMLDILNKERTTTMGIIGAKDATITNMHIMRGTTIIEIHETRVGQRQDIIEVQCP